MCILPHVSRVQPWVCILAWTVVLRCSDFLANQKCFFSPSIIPDALISFFIRALLRHLVGIKRLNSTANMAYERIFHTMDWLHERSQQKICKLGLCTQPMSHDFLVFLPVWVSYGTTSAFKFMLSIGHMIVCPGMPISRSVCQHQGTQHLAQLTWLACIQKGFCMAFPYESVVIISEVVLICVLFDQHWPIEADH